MNRVKESKPAPHTGAYVLIAAFCVAVSVSMVLPATLDPAPADERSTSVDIPVVVEQTFRDGMALAYRGQIEAAVDRFREAIRLDRRCARCLWGMAWAFSVNLEGPVPGEHEALGRSALRRARAVRTSATGAEQDLISALVSRYDAKTNPTSAGRRAAFAFAMEELARSHPEDPDVQVVYALAMLSAETRDHHSENGRALPTVRGAIAAARRALRADADHTGARVVLDHLSVGE